MNALIEVDGQRLRIDLTQGHDLSLGPDRLGEGPRYFGVAPAGFTAWRTPEFIGAVDQGGSCNCNVLTLVPHCHGTHTECVGHLTREPLDAFALLPTGLLPALLLSVTAILAHECDEHTDPPAQHNDLLITARALAQASVVARRGALPMPAPRALVLRTRPNNLSKRQRNYAIYPAPFFTRAAAQWLLDQRVEHLVVDLPSIDRAHDEGRMSAHRLFFGLAAGSHALREATRAQATLTELAFIDDGIADGPGLLLLQAAHLPGDAVPSRPLFYALLPEPLPPTPLLAADAP